MPGTFFFVCLVGPILGRDPLCLENAVVCLLEFYQGRAGVAVGFNTRPALNISTHLHPILPLTQAGFQQNQILSTYPLFPDSGRSDSDLRFGPFGEAARLATR